MANKYCNLVGTNLIKDEFGKINTGFDKVDADVMVISKNAVQKTGADLTGLWTYDGGLINNVITTDLNGYTNKLVDIRTKVPPNRGHLVSVFIQGALMISGLRNLPYFLMINLDNRPSKGIAHSTLPTAFRPIITVRDFGGFLAITLEGGGLGYPQGPITMSVITDFRLPKPIDVCQDWEVFRDIRKDDIIGENIIPYIEGV